MSDKLYWVAVDFDHVPTGSEMNELAEALNDELDHDAIVTTREVEPLSKESVREYLNELLEGIDDE